MREWKAQAYRVMVVDEGFDLNGKTYDSLSKVAFATPAPIGTVRASLVGTRSRLRPGHEDGAVRRSIRCAIYTRVEVT